MAGGPSLNASQIMEVYLCGAYCIAVNDTWKIAPFADVVYANDYLWWARNYQQTPQHAEKWTGSKTAALEFGINFHEMKETYNSGLRSIDLAIKKGADIIILLGFDCSFSSGKKHWHGQHEFPLTNPGAHTLLFWKMQFMRLKKKYPESLIINASGHTELTMFLRMSLTEALTADKTMLEQSCFDFNANYRSK